jgi:Druantia protein DruA
MKRYCGRLFSEADLIRIRAIIEGCPRGSRREFSRQVCRELGWLKPDGALKDMSCRVAMLRMHRDGLIQLPELPAPQPANFQRPLQVSAASDPQTAITQAVHELPELQIELVRGRASSRLWNEYIQRYHYLGHSPLPGAQLRYFVSLPAQPLALLGFGAAAWKTAPRDQFIGWNAAQRTGNLHLILNNARFLILPWVQCKGLASKILGRIARQLPADWQQCYGYRPVLLETFVQSDRFRGTCYKAANWVHVGQTQGRGKLDVTHRHDQPVKDVWLYPLHRQFRELLSQIPPHNPAAPLTTSPRQQPLPL